MRIVNECNRGWRDGAVVGWVRALDWGRGVAEWARELTGDRTVNGSSPAAVKTFRFASELWQFRLPRLASVFRMKH